MQKTITVAHVGNILTYPPVISLLENLLENDNKVILICGTNPDRMPSLLRDDNLETVYIEENNAQSIYKKIERNTIYRLRYIHAVRTAMNVSDILWTTTDVTVKVLGDEVLKHRHVMQLMELIETMPRFRNPSIIRFPIEKYAKKAWKVVVPQKDRAYIQKTWWGLKDVPYVLPNKPYSLDYGDITEEMEAAARKMAQDGRKIILYLGVIGQDRNLNYFADAIKNSDEYVLYLVGRAAYGSEKYLEQLLNECDNIVYLGFFSPPSHLYFLKHAYIGILPYSVEKSSLHYSILNAQYCAPNKIFEYAGFQVPMLGTDVLGIRRPLEEYNMGVVVNDIDVSSIRNGIETIKTYYNDYKNNCLAFYNSVDLNKIVQNIISE